MNTAIIIRDGMEFYVDTPEQAADIVNSFIIAGQQREVDAFCAPHRQVYAALGALSQSFTLDLVDLIQTTETKREALLGQVTQVMSDDIMTDEDKILAIDAIHW